MKRAVLMLLLCILVLLGACSNHEAATDKLDYDQTKKMIVDILKTDEGKKAMQDIMKDEKMKKHLVMDQAVVTDTIEKTLTSDKGKEFWKKAFEDPKFAAAMAKSMQKEQKQLMKDLMKDPEYQSQVLDLMKDPEYTKQLKQLMKSKEYRKQMQDVINDTFESPVFQAKLQDILLKAAEEMSGQKKEGQGQQGQGGQQGGQ